MGSVRRPNNRAGMAEFQIQGASVTFWLGVKPGSKREGLGLNSSGDLRLEVAAPAIEGRANEACIQFLARALRLPQACIVILAGRKSRRKLLRITGHSAQQVIDQLEALTGARKQKLSSHKAKVKRQKAKIAN